MLAESFKITGLAVGQIVLLLMTGFILRKKSVIDDCALNSLSRLVVTITLPCLIFYQLITQFTFTKYALWWHFPLLSIGITAAGLVAGLSCVGFFKGADRRIQFVSLIAFQNSGYLPLPLFAALLPKVEADVILVYLFLFLMGFNLVIWSLGAYVIANAGAKKFELASLFSPPVAATLLSLGIIFLGLQVFIPEFILKPVHKVGECTVPLALLVVGGNLAQIRLALLDKKAMFFVLLIKLILLPAAGLWLVMKLRVDFLVGLLIMTQLAVPPATSLSVIMRHYKKEDVLISQGVFFGHILGVISIPIFLSMYYYLAGR